MMNFIDLTMICSSVVFLDKRHVAPHLSLVVIDLNRVLRFKVFVSEDRQLSVVHLILDFEPNQSQTTSKKWATQLGQATLGSVG